MKISDFVGFKRYPGTTGQLWTSRIDWCYQIQLPEGLYQAKTTSKYQLYRKHTKIQQKMMINTDSESSRPEESFGAIKIIIRIDYTTQNPLQSFNFLHLPVR